MTTRDIQAHLAEVYGAEVSPALISRVTDVVAEEITAWQTRPLDAVYPIVYIDALMLKVRDSGTVDNKAAYLVIGVDTDGFKHVLGIWIAAAEGARFWGAVLTELRNRGHWAIEDLLHWVRSRDLCRGPLPDPHPQRPARHGKPAQPGHHHPAPDRTSPTSPPPSATTSGGRPTATTITHC